MIRLRSACLINNECPAVDLMDDGRYKIRGYDADNESEETEVIVPADMFGVTLPRQFKSAPEMSDFLNVNHRADKLTVETRGFYNSATDDTHFKRFLNGMLRPANTDAMNDWYAKIAEDTAAGRLHRRLRLIHEPLTDYERYEILWGYPQLAEAGEEIRLLTRGANLAWGYSHIVGEEDFFIIDGEIVVTKSYDDDDKFDGAEQIRDSRYISYLRALAGVYWRLSIPYHDKMAVGKILSKG